MNTSHSNLRLTTSPLPSSSCEILKVASQEAKGLKVEGLRSHKKVSFDGDDTTHSQDGSNSPSSTTLDQTKYSPSPSSELKEVEELKESIVTSEGSYKGETVTSAWGKSLKKSLKTDEKLSMKAKVEVVRVVISNQQKEDQSLGQSSEEDQDSNANASQQAGKKGRRGLKAAKSGVGLDQDKSNTKSVTNTADSVEKNDKKGDKEREVAKKGETPSNIKPTRKDRFAKYLKPEQVSTTKPESTEKTIQDKAKVQTTTTIFSDKDIYHTIPLTSEEVQSEVGRKLTCSVLKTSVFDESQTVLGYPIDIEKDNNGKLWPVAKPKILSYDAFVTGLKDQSTVSKDLPRNKGKTITPQPSYYYWLPLYINEQHFQRSKPHILGAITNIYSELEGKKETTFRSEMVLKVLPPLLTKAAANLLEGPKSPTTAGIEVYCQLHQLLVKLIKVFPLLQLLIDQDIREFCSSETKRHEKVTGHLAGVQLKLSLASNDLDTTEARFLLFKEHLTRQVLSALQKDGQLALRQDCDNFVERFMTATQTGNQFMLVNNELTKLVLDENVKGQMEERHGFVNQEAMKTFRARIMWIQKNVNGGWDMLCKGMKVGRRVPNEDRMRSYVFEAFGMAAGKGYV